MIHKTVQGVDVPALGLGTYLLTGRACRRSVAEAIDTGYRHIDTASVYGNEKETGQGLHDAGIAREDIFLTTKIWMDNLIPTRIAPATEKSLSKLRTPYVDLLLIHWPTPAMELEACLDEMQALQAAGKVRHIGVSNFPPALMRRAAAHAPIFCNQVEYHPYLDQSALRTLAQECDALLTAYSPLCRGAVLRDNTLKDIAAAHNKTPAQVTLRWLLQLDRVAAIPKSSGPQHREQNFDLFDFELDHEEMRRIDALACGKRIGDPSWAPAW
ncbi:MAG: aldo/keto reductase [Bacteroidetes bacterium SB0662_bin_6]|nr:aldo/keto reductase [Bacteroidetes bacterium SB0668_bin_1]MYE05516.1 aldo/keto reductase [Bacteroidetes bacterium SB0662_bin_6]